MKERFFVILTFILTFSILAILGISEDGSTTSTIETTTSTTTTMESSTTTTFIETSSTSTTLETSTTTSTTETTTTEQSITTTSTTETTSTTVPTCDLIVSPDLNFGKMTPGDTSDDQSLTITNIGTVPSSLTISGTDWSDGLNIMPVTQTHWNLVLGKTYTEMNELSLPSTSAGADVYPESPLALYFKLRIPFGQAIGDYTQTMTFTGGC